MHIAHLTKQLRIETPQTAIPIRVKRKKKHEKILENWNRQASR